MGLGGLPLPMRRGGKGRFRLRPKVSARRPATPRTWARLVVVWIRCVAIDWREPVMD